MMLQSFFRRSWYSPQVWLVGLLLAMSPEALWAQDEFPDFALHDEPRRLPEIRFENSEERSLSLADFRGKVVLLNIWATWCGPCRHEMPTLDRLQSELGGADFEVLALSIDRAGIDVVRKFYAEVGVESLAIYIDSSGKASRDLSAVGLPTTLLIDRDGRELARLVGPAEWDTPEMIGFLKSHVEETASLLAPASHDGRFSGSADPREIAAKTVATALTFQ